MSEPRFAATSCSSCGADLGPGDSGLSHCSGHRECNGCYRQVRTTESVCPFCKTDPSAPQEPELSAREKLRLFHQRNPNHRRAQMGTFPGARQAPPARGVK